MLLFKTCTQFSPLKWKESAENGAVLETRASVGATDLQSQARFQNPEDRDNLFSNGWTSPSPYLWWYFRRAIATKGQSISTVYRPVFIKGTLANNKCCRIKELKEVETGDSIYPGIAGFCGPIPDRKVKQHDLRLVGQKNNSLAKNIYKNAAFTGLLEFCQQCVSGLGSYSRTLIFTH